MNLIPAGPCPTCKLNVSALPPAKVPSRVADVAARWAVLVAAWGATEDGSPLRHRPARGEWSALDHAGHVRDVFLRCDASTYRLLTEPAPELGPGDDGEVDGGDVIALQDGHGSGAAIGGGGGGDDDGGDDPATVAEELAANAATYQETLAALSEQQWQRSGTLGGVRVDIASLGRHALHQAVHHLALADRLVRRPAPAP